MMTEYPILFNGDMVRAILANRKTQTRRPVKPQPLPNRTCIHFDGSRWFTRDLDRMARNQKSLDDVDWACPFGGPGDSLWVRECWADNIPGCPNGLTYRADHRDPKGDGPSHPITWRPSIHMPRWASRLTLRVKRVWVERVQEISDEDAIAEGVEQRHIDKHREFFDARDIHGLAFRELWDSIYADKGFGWDENPWVFAAEFERETG